MSCNVPEQDKIPQMPKVKSHKEMDELFIGFCGKRYKVGYEPHESIGNSFIRFVEGEMLNYNSGNIVLSNENGVWHIPYDAVKWVIPTNGKVTAYY